DGPIPRQSDEHRKAFCRVDRIDEQPLELRHQLDRLAGERTETPVARRQCHVPGQHVVVTQERRAAEKRRELRRNRRDAIALRARGTTHAGAVNRRAMSERAQPAQESVCVSALPDATTAQSKSMPCSTTSLAASM